MKHSKCQKDIRSAAAYTKITMEATKGIGQKSIKGGTKDCFRFDSWFASKKAAEAAMEFGAKLIGMVKTNTKWLWKDTIEKLKNDWFGVSDLILRSKPVVTGDRPIIAIGYKHNARKILSFIITDNKGSTKTGITYLSKYPDQFTNVAIRPVSRPLVM